MVDHEEKKNPVVRLVLGSTEASERSRREEKREEICRMS